MQDSKEAERRIVVCTSKITCSCCAWELPTLSPKLLRMLKQNQISIDFGSLQKAFNAHNCKDYDHGETSD